MNLITVEVYKKGYKGLAENVTIVTEIAWLKSVYNLGIRSASTDRITILNMSVSIK